MSVFGCHFCKHFGATFKSNSHMEHYLPELADHKKRKAARTIPAHPQEILRAARRHKHPNELPLPHGVRRNEVLSAFAKRATYQLPTVAEQQRWKTRDTDAVNADWWESHVDRVLAEHRVQRDIAKLEAAVDAVVEAALVLSGYHAAPAPEQEEEAADNDEADRNRLFRMHNNIRGRGINAQVMQIANNNHVHAENARGAAPPVAQNLVSDDDDDADDGDGLDPMFTVIISLPAPCDNIRSSIPCEYATSLAGLITAGVAAGPAFLRFEHERVLTCVDVGPWTGIVDEHRWARIKMEAASAVEPVVYRMEMAMA